MGSCTQMPVLARSFREKLHSGQRVGDERRSYPQIGHSPAPNLRLRCKNLPSHTPGRTEKTNATTQCPPATRDAVSNWLMLSRKYAWNPRLCKLGASELRRR